jgi:thymidine kinase
VLCWCGRRGQLNARIVDGKVAREGAQVVIGDNADDNTDDRTDDRTDDAADVRYQVLCRRHHRAGDLGPAARTAGQLRLV